MLVKVFFMISFLNLFTIDSFLLSNICINRNNNLYKLNMSYDKDFAEAISKPHVFVEEEQKYYSEYLNNKNKNKNNYNITEYNKIPKNFELPGFFEVFPELNFNWIEWLSAMKANKQECKKNKDCTYPKVCCPNPIVPSNKFCCNGHYSTYTYKGFLLKDEIKLAIH